MIVPAILFGSVLISFEHLLLGIIIIVLPWIILLLIKKLVTDVENDDLKLKIVKLTKELWSLEKDAFRHLFNILFFCKYG